MSERTPELPPTPWMQGDPALSDRVIADAIDRWVRDLTDLGGRNSLIYPSQIRDAALNLTPSADADADSVQRILNGQRVALSECFQDKRLADAARRGRAIARRAGWQAEETGLQTLYLGLGVVSWNVEDGPRPAAPLLLAGAEITPRGRLSEDFHIEIIGGWEPNLILIQLLKNGFGADLSEQKLEDSLKTFESPAQIDDLFQTVAAALDRACASVPGFRVEKTAQLSNFSYAKRPMVRDLEESAYAVREHLLVSALAGVSGARERLRDSVLPDSRADFAAESSPSVLAGVAGAREQLRDSVVPDSSPDFAAELPPQDEFLVLDADASQSAAINAAIAGRNLVIIGPPGTGKSQTIANLIAALVANEKSILFVAEKRAAIETVAVRLKSVGLGDLLLDVHGGVRDHRRTLEQITQALETARSGTVANDPSDIGRRLVHSRERLAAAVEALHQPVQPWGLSAYDVQGELLAVDDRDRLDRRLRTESLKRLVGETLESVRVDLRDYVNLHRRFVDPQSPWYGAFRRGTLGVPVQTAQAVEEIGQLTTITLPRLRRELASLSAKLGLDPPARLDEAAGSIDLARRIVDSSRALNDAASPWRSQFQAEADLAELRDALQPARGGPVARFVAALLSSRYRQARASVRAALVRQTDGDRETLRLLDWLFDARFAFRGAVTPNLAQEYVNPQKLAEIDLEPAANALQAVEHSLSIVADVVMTGESLAGDLGQVESVLRGLDADRGIMRNLIRLPELRDRLAEAGLDAFTDVEADIERDPDWDGDAAVRAFEYARLQGIQQYLLDQSPEIAAFDAASHNAALRDFNAADRAHVRTNRDRTLRQWAERVIDARERFRAEEAQLLFESKRKRRHIPLRRLFRQVPNLLTRLKPCWAMSPLVVSQLLPNDGPLFDVVIFDEASQVRPADAIPALLRGRQAVIAGDPKQLPPNTFFLFTASDSEDENDDTASGPPTVDLESILDAVATLLPAPYGSRMLSWHYRSRDERLIAFSNHYVYDRQLTTFPGALLDDCITHVEIPRSPDSVYRNASNAAEVREVVQLILDHAERRPHESLGVIALGLPHASRIEETLRRARRTRRDLDDFFSEGGREPFFVKNLERVQGDERDAIIFTVGYGRDHDGRVPNRFGPVAGAGGYRRLNVAITRAKRRMTVVSAFSADDIDPDRFHSEGVRMLGEYIAYAASGGQRLSFVNADTPPLTPFEADVERRLTAAGIPLKAQYGASGYRIDFVAFHPQRPNQPVLAIEADGATYHSGKSARDRDRLRQDHLERLGWRFHRIWSTEWFRNPEREVERCIAAWREAVESLENGAESPSNERAAEPLTAAARQTPQRRSRPNIGPPRATIADYSEAELADLVRWIRSDEKLRTRQELIQDTIKELGYRKRSGRIEAAVRRAIVVANRAGADHDGP